LLAVLLATVLAPSFGWATFAGQAGHGGTVVSCIEAGEYGGDKPAGGADPGARQHHNCAGHLLGVLHDGVRMIFAENRDSPLPAPSAGIQTFFPSRLDRPPLSPGLA